MRAGKIFIMDLKELGLLDQACEILVFIGTLCNVY